MNRSVTLTAQEIETAISDYVEKLAGFRPKRVRLSYSAPDRPWDAETWTATASE